MQNNDIWESRAIGETAGKVWKILHERGAISLSAVEKQVGAPKALVDMAIGWLAREGKIDLKQEKRSIQISLNS
jgi:hypothetical protein